MVLLPISDPDDPRLADFRDLTDVAMRSACEPTWGLYVAEGAAVIGRALAAGHLPRSVLVAEKRAEQAADLLADHPGVAVWVAPEEVVRSVAGYRVHRGFLASMHRPAPRSVAEVAAGACRLLVLEDLVDHTNVGAAFRSAAALGFDAVVLSPRCADPLYRRSMKVSMGAVLQLPWSVAPAWPGALQDLGDDGFALLALSPDPRGEPLTAVAADPPQRLAVLIGTEGSGLSGPALALARRVRIPMGNGVDSLNAAAAAAVACYALGPASGASGAGAHSTSSCGASNTP